MEFAKDMAEQQKGEKDCRQGSKCRLTKGLFDHS